MPRRTGPAGERRARLLFGPTQVGPPCGRGSRRCHRRHLRDQGPTLKLCDSAMSPLRSIQRRCPRASAPRAPERLILNALQCRRRDVVGRSPFVGPPPLPPPPTPAGARPHMFAPSILQHTAYSSRAHSQQLPAAATRIPCTHAALELQLQGRPITSGRLPAAPLRRPRLPPQCRPPAHPHPRRTLPAAAASEPPALVGRRV